MVDSSQNTERPSHTEPAAGEIEVHLAEYAALSEFQRIAKTSFVRLALYHNTGGIILTGWILSRLDDIKSLNWEYLLSILFFFPVVNSVLLIACAYQIYSFYCVAKHFQSLRMRLCNLVSADVLAYENKFVKSTENKNELSIALDIVATGIWLVIPIILAVGFIATPLWFSLDSPQFLWAYSCGSVFSLVALGYLIKVGQIIKMSR